MCRTLETPCLLRGPGGLTRSHPGLGAPHPVRDATEPLVGRRYPASCTANAEYLDPAGCFQKPAGGRNPPAKTDPLGLPDRDPPSAGQPRRRPRVKYTLLFLANFVPNFVQTRLLPRRRRRGRGLYPLQAAAPEGRRPVFCQMPRAGCAGRPVPRSLHRVLWPVGSAAPHGPEPRLRPVLATAHPIIIPGWMAMLPMAGMRGR